MSAVRFCEGSVRSEDAGLKEHAKQWEWVWRVMAGYLTCDSDCASVSVWMAVSLLACPEGLHVFNKTESQTIRWGERCYNGMPRKVLVGLRLSVKECVENLKNMSITKKTCKKDRCGKERLRYLRPLVSEGSGMRAHFLWYERRNKDRPDKQREAPPQPATWRSYLWKLHDSKKARIFWTLR